MSWYVRCKIADELYALLMAPSMYSIIAGGVAHLGKMLPEICNAHPTQLLQVHSMAQGSQGCPKGRQRGGAAAGQESACKSAQRQVSRYAAARASLQGRHCLAPQLLLRPDTQTT